MSLSLMSRESSSSLGISRSSRFMSTSSSRRVIESSLSTSHSLKTSCQSRSDALTTLTMAASLSRFGRLLLCWVFNSTGSSPTPDGRASAARPLPSGESKVISGGWVRRSGGNAHACTEQPGSRRREQQPPRPPHRQHHLGCLARHHGTNTRAAQRRRTQFENRDPFRKADFGITRTRLGLGWDSVGARLGLGWDPVGTRLGLIKNPLTTRLWSRL